MSKKVLHCQLINDLNFFKLYSKHSEIECKEDKRASSNGVVIKGHFIINLTPTNMYNRFARKFGNEVKWFNFTPKDIIYLSVKENKSSISNGYLKICKNDNL